MTLEYWRQYKTYFHIGKSYGISESNCYRNIKWIEDTLIKNPDFQQLFGQKELAKENFKDKTLIIDVTETPIQRPKKVKNNITQEKKKKHTIKTQVIIEKESKQILTTHFSFGKKHDFRLFKTSKVNFLEDSLLIVDTGYQGLQKINHNVLLPKSKSKKNPLNKEQKENNLEQIGLPNMQNFLIDNYNNETQSFNPNDITKNHTAKLANTESFSRNLSTSKNDTIKI